MEALAAETVHHDFQHVLHGRGVLECEEAAGCPQRLRNIQAKVQPVSPALVSSVPHTTNRSCRVNERLAVIDTRRETLFMSITAVSLSALIGAVLVRHHFHITPVMLPADAWIEAPPHLPAVGWVLSFHTRDGRVHCITRNSPVGPCVPSLSLGPTRTSVSCSIYTRTPVGVVSHVPTNVGVPPATAIVVEVVLRVRALMTLFGVVFASA